MDSTQCRRVSFFGSKLVLALSLAILATGCSPNPGPGSGNGGSGSGGSGPGKVCGNEIIKTFTPLKIEGGQHLVFDSEALAIIANPDFQVTSMVLRLDYGKKPKSNSNISIGLNGLEVTRPDGRVGFDEEDDLKKGSSNAAVIRLERMKLGGGILANIFLQQLQRKGGQLRLSIVGSGLKAKSASLEIRGYFKKDCVGATPTPLPTATPVPTPTPGPSPQPTPGATPTPEPTPVPTPEPTPTPVPLPPVVKISSVFPTDHVTSQTTIQFAFEADQAGVTFSCSLDGAAEAVCQSPMIYSGLASGEHQFKVSGVSSQGVRSEVDGTYAWTVDSVASAVTIEPVKPLTNSGSMSVSFNASEEGIFFCSLDGAEPAECKSPLSLNGMGEGIHQIAVFFVDTVGNRGEIATAAWRVDLTAPTVQIIDVMPAGSVSASRSRQFGFSADESVTFECSIDAAEYVGCASPVIYEGLSEGQHIFAVRGIDAAGNVGLAASSAWKSDYTAPVLQLMNVQPAQGKTNALNYAVEVRSDESAGLLCRFDNGEEYACASPVQGELGGDGVHALTIVAVDEAGNRSEALGASWDVNREAAQISFANFVPSAASNINQNSFDVGILATRVAQLSARVNGVDLGPVFSGIHLEDLADGAYEVEVAGVDEYGNLTNSIRHAFTVDTGVPDVVLTSLAASGLPTNERSNTLTFNSNEDARFECQLNGAGFEACASPVTVSGLIDREHVFEVRAIDQAGNLSAVRSATWTVDTIAPITSASVKQNSRNSFTFTFSGDEEGSRFVCSTDGAAEKACTSPMSVVLPEGSHSVVIRAIDLAGNRDLNGASLNVVAYPQVTTILTASTNGTYTSQTSAVFSFSSNQPGATFLCSVNGAAAKACTSPYTLTGLTDGARTFKVQAVDLFGQADSTGASYSWTVDTTAPLITSSSTATASTAITVIWSTNEPSSARVSYGTGFDTSKTTAETAVGATSHSVMITGLTPNTLYSIQPGGKDRAGNVYVGTKSQVRTRF